MWSCLPPYSISKLPLARLCQAECIVLRDKSLEAIVVFDTIDGWGVRYLQSWISCSALWMIKKIEVMCRNHQHELEESFFLPSDIFLIYFLPLCKDEWEFCVAQDVPNSLLAVRSVNSGKRKWKGLVFFQIRICRKKWNIIYLPALNSKVQFVEKLWYSHCQRYCPTWIPSASL